MVDSVLMHYKIGGVRAFTNTHNVMSKPINTFKRVVANDFRKIEPSLLIRTIWWVKHNRFSRKFISSIVRKWL